MTRKQIPKKIKHKILYNSQYVCVVCQNRGGHIHHIDENTSNNKKENLVLLCNIHHDEAHTKHQLSQNLNSDSLHDAKQKWATEVEKRRKLISTMSGQLSITSNNSISSVGLTWGYINHQRVAQLAKPELLTPDDKQYFRYCIQRGIFDDNGILIKPNNIPSSANRVWLK